MNEEQKGRREKTDRPVSRRNFMKGFASITAGLALSGCQGSDQLRDSVESYLQGHYKELTKEEKLAVLQRLEREYKRVYKKNIKVTDTPAMEGVKFGYALDISRCIGCRKCVYACTDENNQSDDPVLQWITVLEMKNEDGIDLHTSNPYYNPETVPEEGKFYFPVACQQCENPTCVKACPVEATWKDDDGIVVIDYDWCIGCRCCMTACPYGARHFNWKSPSINAEKINTDTVYLGNRPRKKGVVEKCTFCIHRTRQGKYPKCVEVCPVGARKFGNMLDPESEINYILKNHRVFILKKELNTEPKFFYYYGV